MAGPDWAALAALDAGDLQQALRGLSDEAMRGLSGAEEEAAAARMPELMRIMWLLNWLDFEGCQGSLLAYFFNSHGRFAMDAVAALERVGASGMAAVLQGGGCGRRQVGR